MDADEPGTKERSEVAEMAELSDRELEQELTIAASHEHLEGRLERLLAERDRRRSHGTDAVRQGFRTSRGA